MASWSKTKQVRYGAVVFFLALLVIGVPVYFRFFNTKPTCSDKIINQNELDVDCGGVCEKLCKEESRDPIIIFERAFETAPGTYTLLANVENPNQNAFALEAKYVFSTFDKDNVLLNERRGTTYISPNNTFPVVEYKVFLDQRIPSKTTLSFIDPIDWKRGDFKEPSINFSNIKISEGEELPTVEADLKNGEVYEVRNIKAIAVIYDAEGNAMGVSSTVVERLAPKESKRLFFTWNLPFNKPMSRVDIFPRVLPRDLK